MMYLSQCLSFAQQTLLIALRITERVELRIAPVRIL
jgi:hypothetical protein